MGHWWEQRRFDPTGRAAWQTAVAKSHPEINAVYPPGFWTRYALFCAGDTSHLNMAIAFLEADPWVFGSGCVKEDFIHGIKHMDLPPVFVTRLQRISSRSERPAAGAVGTGSIGTGYPGLRFYWGGTPGLEKAFCPPFSPLVHWQTEGGAQRLSSHAKESRYFVPTCARISVTLPQSVSKFR